MPRSDRVPDELWMEVRDIVQDTGIKTIPMEKKCKKPKWLSGEALQIAVKSREVKSNGEKERYKHLNAEFQRISHFSHLLTSFGRQEKTARHIDEKREVRHRISLFIFFNLALFTEPEPDASPH